MFKTIKMYLFKHHLKALNRNMVDVHTIGDAMGWVRDFETLYTRYIRNYKIPLTAPNGDPVVAIYYHNIASLFDSINVAIRVNNGEDGKFNHPKFKTNMLLKHYLVNDNNLIVNINDGFDYIQNTIIPYYQQLIRYDDAGYQTRLIKQFPIIIDTITLLKLFI